MGWGFIGDLAESASTTFKDITGDSDWGGQAKSLFEEFSGGGGGNGGSWMDALPDIGSKLLGGAASGDDDDGGWFNKVVDTGKSLFGAATEQEGGTNWMSDITDTAKSWLGEQTGGSGSGWLNEIVATGSKFIDGDSGGDGGWLGGLADKAEGWMKEGLGDTFNSTMGGGFGDLGFKDLGNVIKTVSGTDGDFGLPGNLMNTGGEMIADYTIMNLGADAQTTIMNLGGNLAQQGESLWGAAADQLPSVIHDMDPSTLQNVIAQGGTAVRDMVGKLDDDGMTDLLTKLSQAQTTTAQGQPSSGAMPTDVNDDMMNDDFLTGGVVPTVMTAQAPAATAAEGGATDSTPDPLGLPDPTFDQAPVGADTGAGLGAVDPTAPAPEMQIEPPAAEEQDDFVEDIAVADNIEDSLGELT